MALEQPKKPVGGAYGSFLTEKRPEFKKACEGQPVSAISKMAGDQWKKLSDAEKAPYQKKYEAAKAKFDKDLAAFLAAGGEKAKGAAALRSEKKKTSMNGKKDPNRPKKPAGGAYGVFLGENRAKIIKSLPDGHKMTDVSKAAGAQWKALSDSAKEPYVVAYGKKAEEYQKALEAYKAANPSGAVDEEEEDEEDEEEENNEDPSSSKRPASAGASGTPTAKRGRAGKAKSSSSEDPSIDAAVLKEADALGMTSQLKNLMSRPDVQATGKSQKEMLAALQGSNGLVNKAKSILLGA